MKKEVLRSCFICKKKLVKKELFRIVKQKDGSIKFDETSGQNGRGGYVCDNDECIDKIKTSKIINNVFKTNLTNEQLIEISEKIKEYKKGRVK